MAFGLVRPEQELEKSPLTSQDRLASCTDSAAKSMKYFYHNQDNNCKKNQQKHRPTGQQDEASLPEITQTAQKKEN